MVAVNVGCVYGLVPSIVELRTDTLILCTSDCGIWPDKLTIVSIITPDDRHSLCRDRLQFGLSRLKGLFA
jgi:hypothetical protein